MKKFFKTAGWTLLYLSIYYAIQIIYIIVAGIILTIKTVVQNPDISQDMMGEKVQTLIGNQLTMSIIVSAIWAFGLYYLICKARKQDIFQVCQFNKISWQQVLMFIPAGMGLVFINGFMLSLLNRTEVMNDAFSKHVELMEQLLGGNVIIVFLSVAIAAPFIEEVIFRGLILKELRRNMSVRWAIVLQALLFGLYHMQLVQGIYTFFMGILLGVVCVWLKSIWPAIILHLLNNLTSMGLSRMENLDLLNSLKIPIIIISIVVVSVVTIYAYRNRIQEDNQDSDEAIVIL